MDQPITVTITFDPKSNTFTVSANGEEEKFTAVDRALQEARGYLTGMTEEDESSAEEAKEGDAKSAFAEGFQKARGVPL